MVKSPLHPWIGTNTAVDSSVFKTVALMMEKGNMPYKDSFDHKGPLIYIINYLGNGISSYCGVWAIELFFMMITFFMMYKTARLVCKAKHAFVVLLVSVSLLFTYFEGGNLTEEYAMPFIAVSLYIFIDYLKNNKISILRLVICGFGLGSTLLLRPNMISAWMVFSIIIFLMSLVKKEWKKLSKFIVWFILGLVLILGPILVWLIVNNALGQFWEAYIVFNKEYSIGGDREIFIGQWNSFFSFGNTTVCIICFIVLIYIGSIKDKLLNLTYLVYMITTLALMCISGSTYGHYGMILVPAVAYPLSLIFAEIEGIEYKQVARVISLLVCLSFLSTIVFQDWIGIAVAVPSIYSKRNEDHKSEEEKIIADIVNTYTDESEAISVYGNWDYIYVIANRRHATRYSYQFPIGQVMPSLMEEYMEELQEELPPLIIIQEGFLDDNITNFLNINQYNLLCTENGAMVYKSADKNGEL